MFRQSSSRSLFGVVGLLFALLAVLVISPAAARAQPFPGAQPGIVATGFGAASAPADSAELQFLLSAGGFGEFGPIMPPMEGTPMGEMPPDAVMTGPSQLTEEQLAPVVDALVAAGASQDAITVTVPATSSAFFGPGGPETGDIRVELAQPATDQLSQIVDAATTAANEAGLSLLHVGARFDTSDCATLVQSARDAAVADAQERAEGLTQAVGATLGDLVQASESPYFGPEGGDSCAAEGLPSDIFGPYGPGTLPPYDPAAPAEAETYIQVTLTFAFDAATDATPSP